jgi:hypothetical protein
MPVPILILHPGACRLTQVHKLSFIQKGQDGLPHSSRIEYFVHGCFHRFENDKGLQYAKWCQLPLMLRCNTQHDIHEAICAFDDVRDEAHDQQVEAWHCEMDMSPDARAVSENLRAAQKTYNQKKKLALPPVAESAESAAPAVPAVPAALAAAPSDAASAQ